MSKGFLIRKADKVVIWRKDEQDWDKERFPEDAHEFRPDDDSDSLVPELRNQISLNPEEFKWDKGQQKMIAKSDLEKDEEKNKVSESYFDTEKSDLVLLIRAVITEIAEELSGVTAKQLSDRIKSRFQEGKRSE